MSDLACRDTVELASAFLDQELEPVAEELVGAHLPTCAGCRSYLGQVQFVIDALAGLGPAAVALPQEVTSALLAVYRTGRQAS